jgi:mRNA interferase RelE/StbE
MIYSVEFSPKALKSLKKMNRRISANLLAWIKKNLDGCQNPRAHGKALAADLSGLWRYRIGDYRIIAEILDNTITIVVLEIGHRSVIYKKR